jgi:hypothetical protein
VAATYDITSHPLLSEKAKALFGDAANVFDAVVVAAERTLGLHGTGFTGEDAEEAKLAVVLETNYELEQTPESEVMSRVDRGERVYQYKPNLSSVHPRAEKIANRLLEKDKLSAGSKTKNYSSVGVSNNVSWYCSDPHCHIT